jgi:two-component system sensor histidine kinase BaeS
MTPERVESIPLQRQDVDVGVLLELTTEVMQRQAKTLGIALTVRIDDDVPASVHLDRDKVAWAITSLVGSALRHVRGPRGSVDVHVSCADPSGLAVCVRDNGPGIPGDQLSKLLERDAWRPGSALALLLVEDIAVAHGGGVRIQSRTDPHDHFTSICFTIPLS